MAAEVPPGFVPGTAEPGSDELLGPVYEMDAGDDYVCAIRVDPRHVNRRGAAHGGLLFTLADHTLGNMVWARAGGRPCATVSLNVDYLAGVRAGDWVECRGRITRETRSMVFIKGELTVGGEVMVTATGVWKKLGVD